MRNELKAFGFSIIICFGMVLVYFGIYLMASPIQTFDFVLKEIIAGIILLALGLFCVIFTINYTHFTSKKSETAK